MKRALLVLVLAGCGPMVAGEDGGVDGGSPSPVAGQTCASPGEQACADTSTMLECVGNGSAPAAWRAWGCVGRCELAPNGRAICEWRTADAGTSCPTTAEPIRCVREPGSDVEHGPGRLFSCDAGALSVATCSTRCMTPPTNFRVECR